LTDQSYQISGWMDSAYQSYRNQLNDEKTTVVYQLIGLGTRRINGYFGLDSSPGGISISTAKFNFFEVNFN